MSLSWMEQLELASKRMSETEARLSRLEARVEGLSAGKRGAELSLEEKAERRLIRSQARAEMVEEALARLARESKADGEGER